MTILDILQQGTERQRRISAMRNRGMTLRAIGDELGLSWERIRQIIKKLETRTVAIEHWRQVLTIAKSGTREELLAVPIEMLVFDPEGTGVGSRIQTCCRNAKIATIGDLIKNSPDYYQHTRDLGRKSLNHILATLAELGLELDNPYRQPPPPEPAPPEPPRAVADYKLAELELSVRVYNCLIRDEGLVTIGDLIKYTRAELLHIPNFGRISLAEVEGFLDQLGVALAG